MQKKTINTIATFLIFGIAVWMGIYLGKHLALLRWTDFLWIIVFFVVSMFLIIHIHELGHFLFGKLSGYKLILYKVGPLCWKYENGHYRFETEKMKGYLGLCMMMAPAGGVSRRANMLYYAGGVLMNLFTGTISLLIAFFADTSLLLFLALSIFGLLSVGMAILNIRPTMSQYNPTDGMILWNVWQGTAFAAGFDEIHRLQMELSIGKRPRDLETNVEPGAEPLDNYIRIYQLIYLLYKALDGGDAGMIRRQADLIDGIMGQIPSAIEDAVAFELAAAYAFVGDIEKARDYYDSCWDKLEKENDSNGNRIKAFCAWYLEGDATKTAAFCYAGLAVIAQYPLKGQAVMEEDLMKRLLQEVAKKRIKGSLVAGYRPGSGGRRLRNIPPR